MSRLSTARRVPGETAHFVVFNRKRLLILFAILAVVVSFVGARAAAESLVGAVAFAPLFALQMSIAAASIIFQFVIMFWFLSRPRKYTVTPDDAQIGMTFESYRGQPDLLEHARSTVRILQGAKDFEALGGEMPKGLLLSGTPGTGKCITGDSLILTSKGMMRIDEAPIYFAVDGANRIHGMEAPSFSLDQTSFINGRPSHWYAMGRQPTVKITTRQGIAIEGTNEHPLVVMDDRGQLVWRELGTVQIGDQVAISFGTQCFGTRSNIDIDLAYLMGLLVGDGHMGTSNRIDLTSIDAEIVDFFRTFMIDRFGYQPHQNGITHIVTSWKIKTVLIKAGLRCVLSYNKEMPASIAQAPKQILVAFLQGLFDTDGSAPRRRGGIAEYGTASATLAQQMLVALLNLGIVAKLEQRSTKGRNQWHIMISGASLATFEREVGFRLARKRDALRAAVAEYRVNTNVDVIPFGTAFLNDLRSSLHLRGIKGTDLSREILRGRISRPRLVHTIGEAEPDLGPISHARRILDAQLFFSPVVEIAAGEAEVFDFTVPDTHAFVANGLISHNTFLASVIASEAHLPFIYIDASSLRGMFLGMTEMMIMKLFRDARGLGRKYAAPGKRGACILFMDEIDSIGQARGGQGGIMGGGMMGMMGGGQGLNTLLNQMDSLGDLVEDRMSRKILRKLGIVRGPVSPKPLIFVIGATNRPEVLDPALVRPGRLDRTLVVYTPDAAGRRDIISFYLAKKAHDPGIDLAMMVADAVGWSPIQIKTILNEALVIAHDDGRAFLTYRDWLHARDNRFLGIKQPISSMSAADRRAIAYHEAGHAVVAHYLQPENRTLKASIIRMGDALGVVQRSPSEERYTRHASEIETDIMVSLGSRVVEELVLDTKLSGASSDLASASALALAYVAKLGMGDSLFVSPDGDVRASAAAANELLNNLYDETRRLLTDKRAAVEAVAEALIERQELIGPELLEVYATAEAAHPELRKPFERKRPTFDRKKSVKRLLGLPKGD